MKLLQWCKLLPADNQRFGYWRTFLASLTIGPLLFATLGVAVEYIGIQSVHLSEQFLLLLLTPLPGLLIPWLWNRRAVAHGAPPVWMLRGRTFQRWAIATASLVTAVFLAFAIEGARAARAWQAVEAHLKQRGEPLTYEDLLGPKVPDDQNFARHPLMDGLLSHTATNDAKGRTAFRWTGQRKLAELQDALRFPESIPDKPKNGKPLRWTGPDLEVLASVLKSGTKRANRTVYDSGRAEPRETNDLFHLPIPPAGMPAAQAVLYGLVFLRALL